MQFTPIPNIVFSSLLPDIADVAELKVLLYIFSVIYPKKGKLRFATEKELVNLAGLTKDKLHDSLTSLVTKRVVLHLAARQDSVPENIYLLNTEANQINIHHIEEGKEIIPGFVLVKSVTAPSDSERPLDVFTVYEQNIGILTPLIAEELKEACKQYPEAWIKDAIKEAADLNRRNWRFISRVLEHWSTEGKDNGAYRGYPKKNADPGKYTRGKYGHMVQ